VKQAFEIYKEVAGVEAEASQREPVSQDVLKEVSPKATGFVKIENAEEIYEATDEGFVYVGEAEGFMDKIVAAIAMDKDGAITAIKFVEINESPDYGMDLTKESYLAKYIGKKSGDTLDSVSGATVSSDAFNKIVSKALETVETVKGAK
ncbi:MAG: FMN-binding protein, partial [Oscillospiraceae bacterium]